MIYSKDVLFTPILAMFLWTFLVMLLNVGIRVHSVLRGKLTNKYYELFLGGPPPETVLKIGNHFRNLFEMPLLFYVVGILIIVTQRTDEVFLVLAWAYFGLRVCHSLVHLTVNNVPVRFAFFILSNLVLLVLWLRLAWLL